MLSVQTAGCAGMERLCVPARTLNTSPDDIGQFGYRMRVDALHARELLAVHGETVIRSSNNNNYNLPQHHKQHSSQQTHQQYQRMTTLNSGSDIQCGSGSRPSQAKSSNTARTTPSNQEAGGHSSHSIINSSNSVAENYSQGGGSGGSTGLGGSSRSCCSSTCSSVCSHSHDHHQHYQHELQQQQTLCCPHHVPLPDGEWNQNRNTALRADYQQSELTRSYIKPPPNKTVKDVPLQSSYKLHSLTSQPHYLQHHYNMSASCSQQQATAPSKLKPSNVITKLFSRKSSPKSPTSSALSSSSSSSTCSSSLAPSASMSLPSISSSASSLITSSSSSSVSPSSSASSLSAASLAALPSSSAALQLKSTPCSYGNSASMSVNTAVLGGQLENRIPTPPLSVSVPLSYQQHQQHHTHQHKHFQKTSAHLESSSSGETDAFKSVNLSPSCEGLIPPSSSSACSSGNITRNNSNSSMCNCNKKNCNICGT